jgi:hypothetical protein
MVDNIEITLDEIKDTSLKTQAQVDRLMREEMAMGKFFAAAQKTAGMGLPGSTPGFLDSIIKGITSKGIMGGLVAGGAAGGVLALIDVIKDLTKQSKILTTIQDTVGKSLGLLVDLVLLPFLPLLIFGLLYLYTAIMWVGKIWNDWIQKQLTGGLGEAIDKVINPPADSTALSRTIDFLSLMNELAKAWFDGMRRIILGTLVFFAELIIQIGKFIWELIGNISKIIGDGWLEFQKLVVEKIKEFIEWLPGAWKNVADNFDENFIKPIQRAIDRVRTAFIDFITFAINKINEYLPPGFKIGPQVEIVQSGKQGQFGSDWTGNTYNFNGLTMPELENKIIEINNRESRVNGSRLFN